MTINNVLHIITSNYSNYNDTKHVIFNDDNQSFKTLYHFPDLGRLSSGARLLYRSKHQQLLILGGNQNNGWGAFKSIYAGDLVKNEWKILSLDLIAHANFGAVLTEDQRYIIKFAGRKFEGEWVAKDELHVEAGRTAVSTLKKVIGFGDPSKAPSLVDFLW